MFIKIMMLLLNLTLYCFQSAYFARVH